MAPGDLMLGAREPALVAERLEQHGEAEPRRPRLVGQQRQLPWIERPVLGQLLARPLSLHAAPPRSGWRARVPRSRSVGTFLPAHPAPPTVSSNTVRRQPPK